jgi:hypothetical protein
MKKNPDLLMMVLTTFFHLDGTIEFGEKCMGGGS